MSSQPPSDGYKQPRRRDTRVAFDPSYAGSETSDESDGEEEVGTAPREERWWTVLVAGGAAGAVSRTSVAPLERLKILFQVQGISARSEPLRHTGVFMSLVDLYKKEGVRGLWKGNGLNCVRVIPSSAIQFAAYAFYKRWFFGDDGSGTVQLATWQHLVAGGMAGATSTTCTYPLDLMRARKTVDFRGGASSGFFSGMAHIAKTEGVRGLFRGLIPSLCGIIPYIGIDFAIFDYAKRICKRERFGLNSDGDLRPVTKITCGAVAGVCGMTVAFPFDTIRRNLQVASLKVRSETGTIHTTMRGTVAALTKHVGWRALYRGLLPNYLKAGPSVGISFATFEYVKERFDTDSRSKSH